MLGIEFGTEEMKMNQGLKVKDEKLTISAARLRDLANVLQNAATHCGSHVTARQVQALLLIAEANKAERNITRGELEQMFANPGQGTVSKMLRGMMHVKMERKGKMANTVEGLRSKDDLRVVYLHLTDKGKKIVNSIVS